MFEFHGWVTIDEAWCEAQEDDELLDEQVRAIRREADRLVVSDFGCTAEVAISNGLPRLVLHGFRNHRQPWVLELFKTAGRIAKGSYGLLYVRDDEDPEFENEFQVWIMIRGEVKRGCDSFLSPCMPRLEE